MRNRFLLLVALLSWNSPALFAADNNANTAQADVEVQQMTAQGDKRAQAGDYKGAIELYENALKKYSTNPYAKLEVQSQIQFNLGYSYYFTGEEEKAIANFKLAASPKNPMESIREKATLMQATAQANIANKQKDGPKKAELFDSAIKAYNEFLRNFSKSSYRPDAFYGKAVALLQSDKVDDAEKSLQEFFKNKKETLFVEANYLLARIYTAQAKKLQNEQNPAEAKAKFAKAKEIYDYFINSSQDLILANESFLSAGDVMIKSGNFDDAIHILHNVRPKSAIEQRQNDLLNSIFKERAQAMANGNQALADDLTQQYDKVKARMANLTAQDSIFFKAQLLISSAYSSQEKYDEVLILNRHMLPRLSDEDKKLANYLIIKALSGKGDADGASQAYTQFEKDYPKDSLLEDLIMSLARTSSLAGKFDEAIKWAQMYKTNYPNGKELEEVYYMLVDSYNRAGKAKEAQDASDAFRTKFPKSTLAGEALFQKALAQYTKKEWQTASTDFREFIDKYPTSDNAKYAILNLADCYAQLGQNDACVAALKEFEKSYSNSDLYAKALYQMAKAYERARDMNQANATYKRIVTTFPAQLVSQYAQYDLARNLLSSGPEHINDAVAALDEFIKLFPVSDILPNVYFCKAEIFRTQKKIDEAVKSYTDVIEKFPKTEPAADSVVAIADIYAQQATSMAARPDKLPADKQQAWKDQAQKAVTTYEKVAKEYPNSSSVDKALSQISVIWQSRINAKFNTKEEAKDYFDKLAAGGSSAFQNKVAFTLGGLLKVLNENEAALEVLAKAYEKAASTSLPNEGYKQYRAALMESKQYDKAKEVSERQLKEKKEAGDMQGIAEAELGIGRVYFEKNDYPSAAPHLTEVVQKYPWVEAAANEAEFLLIRIETSKKNYDDAIKRYKVLAGKARDPELKINIFLHSGYTWLAKSENVAQGKKDSLKEALGYFIRVGTAFGAYPAYASEGLYMSAGIYEKYGSITEDAREKAESMNKAVMFYKKCSTDYPTTPWSAKSKDRLRALGK